jgi:hypothetical protein
MVLARLGNMISGAAGRSIWVGSRSVTAHDFWNVIRGLVNRQKKNSKTNAREAVRWDCDGPPGNGPTISFASDCDGKCLPFVFKNIISMRYYLSLDFSAFLTIHPGHEQRLLSIDVCTGGSTRNLSPARDRDSQIDRGSIIV